jgi:hypothetical protein
MIRVPVLVLVMCGLLSCGGEEAADGGYNALCTKNSDCGDGLVCAGSGVTRGICTSMCTTDADCVVHRGETKCVGAGLGSGFCYDTCMDSVQCPRTHTCTMTATEAYSTCRASN